MKKDESLIKFVKRQLDRLNEEELAAVLGEPKLAMKEDLGIMDVYIKQTEKLSETVAEMVETINRIISCQVNIVDGKFIVLQDLDALYISSEVLKEIKIRLRAKELMVYNSTKEGVDNPLRIKITW